MAEPQPKTANAYRTLLAATDFSETAEAGIDWAVEVARGHGARLILVHGLNLPPPLPDFVATPPDFHEDLQAAAQQRLEQSANRVRKKGVEVVTEFRPGLPSQVVLETAVEREADLIVLGTRGLTGLGHLLLGSTAERVVQRAACPVLTVHPEDIRRHRPVRKILVPTDFSRDAELASHAALDLLVPVEKDARIVLLHAYHLPVEYTAYGTIPTSLNYLQDVGAEVEARLEELAQTLRREGLAVECLAREGYPPQVIVEVAEEKEVDLIAMGTRGRTGLSHLLLGSTAERVVQKAPCPVLTVRRPAE